MKTIKQFIQNESEIIENKLSHNIFGGDPPGGFSSWSTVSEAGCITTNEDWFDDANGDGVRNPNEAGGIETTVTCVPCAVA